MVTVVAWRELLRQRRTPLVLGGATVLSGLAFSFFWIPLTGHGSGWVQSTDLWGIYRSAQYVAWGDIGDIARAVTLPGIAVLLAPVALVAGTFGMSASYPHLLAHPTAWLVLAPVEMTLGALALLPLDALAVRQGIRGRRRIALCAAEATVLWPLVVMWGHAEDALAIGASVAALMAVMDRRWRPAGWWFGAAVALQPLVLVLLPLVVLGLVPGISERVRFVARSAIPSAVLLAIPLARNWQLTTSTMFQQANYPSIDHPTPWLFLAPVVRPAHWAAYTRVVHSTAGFAVHRGRYLVSPVVGTGPGHLVALGVALLVGLLAWRLPPTPSGVLWLGALCLTLRCAFGSVEDPYYVWPALALLLISAAAQRGWQFPIALGAALAETVFAEFHLGPWSWYVPVILLLGVGLACAWPSRDRPKGDTARVTIENGTVHENPLQVRRLAL